MFSSTNRSLLGVLRVVLLLWLLNWVRRHRQIHAQQFPFLVEAALGDALDFDSFWDSGRIVLS